MKIYIVINNNGTVRGAYTTRAKAEKAKEKENWKDEMGGGRGGHWVEEVEVEE